MFAYMAACWTLLLFITAVQVTNAIENLCETSELKRLWKEALCISADGCSCQDYTHRAYCKAGQLHVDLSSCEIFSLAKFAVNFSEHDPGIVFLNLSHNSIGKFSAQDFSGSKFRTLKVLDLAFNLDCYSSDSFGPGVFEGLTELETLSLSLVNDDEDAGCKIRANFLLDNSSITSLSHNLTQLHVTGSRSMSSLGRLLHLSVLNLGGTSCNLTNQSNLEQLNELNITRLSLRGCKGHYTILNTVGVVDLLHSVVYLDVSCANIVLDNIWCKLPTSLRVLIMDQDDQYVHQNYCTSKPAHFHLNVTAASFSSYQRGLSLPDIDNSTFPFLTRLAIPKAVSPLWEHTGKLLDISVTNLKYLTFLDVSSVKTQTSYSCAYHTVQYHPWFLADDYDRMPSELPDISICTKCSEFVIPSRLSTLRARDNDEFPLNVFSRHANCSFKPNNLTIVDVSDSEVCSSDAARLRCLELFGMESVKTVLARRIKEGSLCSPPYASYILEVFPGLTELDLDGATSLRAFSKLSHDNLTVLRLNDLSISSTIFPDSQFKANITQSFPKLKNLSASDNDLEGVDLVMPSSLLLLNLSNNRISAIESNTQSEFSRHADSHPHFQLDLRGNRLKCECMCNGSNFEFLKWLTKSSFVLFDELCDSQIEHSTVRDCVDSVGDQCSTTLEPYVTAIIVIIGVLVVAVVVTGFCFLRRYQWRFRIWFMTKFTRRLPKRHIVTNSYFLSYCTESEDQSTMAFTIWDYARRNELGIVIRSKYDINPGEWQNYMISKYIRGSHKVLLLMPDNQYSTYDSSMYEFQLAIRFHEVVDIHPVVRDGVDDIESIVGERFPPLVAGALRPSCKPIYPSSTNTEDITAFFENLQSVANFHYDNESE